MVGSLTTLWTTLRQVMPTSCTINIPNSGETYEDTTGELTEVWTGGTAFVSTGAQSGVFAQGVGFRLLWATGGITNGRRVRGSTFVVPASAAMYAADGTLDATQLDAVRTAVTNFAAARATDLTIWTRPRPGVPGKSSGVTGTSVPDKVTTLRSRRT